VKITEAEAKARKELEKQARVTWLNLVTPKLEKAAKQLRDARSYAAPAGDVEDKMTLELAVIAEEIGDVYVRLRSLAERVAIETISRD
jgi:hypothetical protein